MELWRAELDKYTLHGGPRQRDDDAIAMMSLLKRNHAMIPNAVIHNSSFLSLANNCCCRDKDRGAEKALCSLDSLAASPIKSCEVVIYMLWGNT